MRRTLSIALVLAALTVGLSACLATPGDTSKITFVSTATVDGWRYDYYKNSAYPCSVSGVHTFVVGTKVGSSPTATGPLWVFLHGGGVGFFGADGQPKPDTKNTTEETAASLRNGISNAGLAAKVRADAAGFRTLAVSYCNRDLYSGTGQLDPNNPNLTDEGTAKTTSGMLATKAAIAFVEQTYPTGKYFLAGGSAGSVGAYHVGYGMQVSGHPPAGVIGDASIVNAEAGEAGFEQGVCVESHWNEAQSSIIAQRIDPAFKDRNNQIDRLVSRGDYTVPLLHVWNHGDKNTCGSVPLSCPLRNGTSVTMGMTDCIHQPLQAAIEAQGPSSRSKNLPLCVDIDATPDCSQHVVLGRPDGVNTDPASPADYGAAAMDWVRARLVD